jgi:sortase (surface protein transpeptidase)
MSIRQRRAPSLRLGLPLLAGAMAALLIAGTVVTMVTAVPGVRPSGPTETGPSAEADVDAQARAAACAHVDKGPVTSAAVDQFASGSAMAMDRATPVRLRIPSIGIDSTLIELGLQDDGRIEVPPSGFPAGWFTGAPTPGELGPAVVVGHVDWDRKPGVFFDLWQMTAGETIAIAREDGSMAVFRVTEVLQVSKDAFPTQAVYGDLDHAGLRLITCGGVFDQERRRYVDNLIVFAVLVTDGWTEQTTR